MLKGLQYVGNGHGLSVMLYGSYKSVTVTWDKPYHFTQRDNISDEAKKYYLKNYRPLGIKLIEEREADTEPDQIKDENPVETPAETPAEETPVETPVEEGVKNPEDAGTTEEENPAEETPVEGDDAEEETPAETPAEEKTEVSLDSVVKSVVEEYGREVIESASVGDLGEVIDAKFDEDLVKELCSKVDYSYGRTRNKSKIINGLLEEKLADVVAYFLA